MKRLVQFAGMLLALSGVVSLTFCRPDTPTGPEPAKNPAAPTGLKCENITEVSVDLVWEGATTDYEIVLGELAPQAVTGKKFAAKELTPDTKYTWKVRAKEGELYSDWTDGPGFTTNPEPILPPDAPTTLLVSNVGQTTATLTWEGVTANYEIELDGEVCSVDAKTYTSEALTPDTKYAWRVRAVEGELVSEWADGETFTTVALPIIDPPTALAVTGITHKSAVFTWEGTATATRYEIVVGDAEAVTVDATTWTATGLTSEKNHTWKVRAIEGELASVWVDGEAFATLSATLGITYTRVDRAKCNGADYGPGTTNFDIALIDYDPGSGDCTGHKQTLDIISAAVAMPSNQQYLDIPEGTYTFDSTRAPGTVTLSNYSWFREVLPNGDFVEPHPKIESGSITVSGDHASCVIMMNIALDDGRQINGVYMGPMLILNPSYIPPLEFNFTEGSWRAYASGSNRNYYVSLKNEGYKTGAGVGHLLMIDLYAPGVDNIIPDGTYTVGGSDAWYIKSLYTKLSIYADGVSTGTHKVVSGTVKTTKTGVGQYIFEIDLVTVNGIEIKTTYSGAMTTTTGAAAPPAKIADEPFDKPSGR